MKKVLGISLVAVLTATPLMARADDVTILTDISGSALTTQSYVKGAYNALGGYINTKQDKLTAGQAAVSTSVVQEASIKGSSSSASDTALMSEKAIMKAIETAQTAATYDDTELSQAVESLEENSATQTGVDNTIKAVSININDQKTVSSSLTGDISQTGGTLTVANSWTDASDTTTIGYVASVSKGTLDVNTTLGGTITASVDADSVSYATANE